MSDEIAQPFRINGDHETYIATIKRTSDGLIKKIRYGYENDNHAVFMWTDHNWGCDCNRRLDFQRALGIAEDDIIDNPACTEHEYLLVSFVNEKTGNLLIANNEVWRPGPTTGIDMVH